MCSIFVINKYRNGLGFLLLLFRQDLMTLVTQDCLELNYVAKDGLKLLILRPHTHHTHTHQVLYYRH